MITSTLRTAFLLFATTTITLAQVDDILANTATFKPRITVSDHYSESVDVTYDSGDYYRELVADPESIAITVVANLDGADTGVIDADTAIGVTAWHFDHSATLGEALDYKPGVKKVTFPLTMDVDLPSGDTRTVRVGTVSYAWTAKTLTCTVTCTDVAGAGVGDVAASDYASTADLNTALAISNDPIDISVFFGDATGARRAFVKGFTRTVLRKFGSEARGDYEEFEVCDVSLLGAADVTGPTVKTTFPAKPTVLNTINVAGTAYDLEDVSLDSVTVNGVAAAGATVAMADGDGNGTWDWSVTGVALKKGVNKVVVNFSDEDGNATSVTKSYTILK